MTNQKKQGNQYKTYDELIRDLYKQKNSKNKKVAKRATKMLNEMFASFVRELGTPSAAYPAVKAWADLVVRLDTRDEKVTFT